MITITKATTSDCKTIATIGSISVEEAHRESCSAKDMQEFLDANYNEEAIEEELRNEANRYHLIFFNGTPAGFSKIVFNTAHPNIPNKNVTKLDRIYLLREYFDHKLGAELLQFNIELSKANAQAGMWLFTWVENKRAVKFYRKAGFSIVGEHLFKVTDHHSNLNHQLYLTFT